MVSGHVVTDLAAYAERRLSAQRLTEVEAHLAVCRACQAAAAETEALVEALQAAPAALRGLEHSAGRHWPEIWARVTADAPAPGARRRPSGWRQLSVYMSLMAVAFSAATLLPGTFGLQPAVTAGVVETPAAHALTPRAGQTGQAEPVTLAAVRAEATASAARLIIATPAGPAPAPTPKTGP